RTGVARPSARRRRAIARKSMEKTSRGRSFFDRVGYGIHTSQMAGAFVPQLAGEGGAEEAPDGVWPAASPQLGLHERHREPAIEPSLLSAPHPALRATFPASRRRGDSLTSSSRP